jgi:hypothetical protein
MPIFNYQKLKGRIIEQLETNGKFAELMEWSRPTLSRKLTGESEWTQGEIYKACKILTIELSELHLYFFVESVQD